MRRKVLVVDDNPVTRELVREALQSPLVEVLEAANGQEALDIIREAVPDLVLLDLRMPAMDGFSVLQAIRQRLPLKRLPVLAFTAHAMRGDSEKAIAAGFDGYITKPVRVEALREQIGRYLLSEGSNFGTH